MDVFTRGQMALMDALGVADERPGQDMLRCWD